MALKFLYIPKPRRFSFKPRFYSEEKERVANLLKQAESSNSYDSDKMRSTIRDKWARKKGSDKKNQNMRLVIIIAVLCALTYLILR